MYEESQIRSIVCFDFSRAFLITLCSWIKSTSIILLTRGFSPVKATHIPSNEKEPYICIGLDLELTSPHLKDRNPLHLPVPLSSHNLPADWDRELLKPSEDAEDHVV